MIIVLLDFILAVRTGLEPATPCVTGMYSNQLNYHTKNFNISIQKTTPSTSFLPSPA